MAELPAIPKGQEFEELVAATFQSSGFYIDKNVEDQYSGIATLEIDAVASMYTQHNVQLNLIEVKSGAWGFRDLFTLRGWMTYLQVERALFIATGGPDLQKQNACKELAPVLGIAIVICAPEELNRIVDELKSCGYDISDNTDLRDVWRFVYWAERNLVAEIRRSSQRGNAEARRAKEYHRLVNNKIFFKRTARDRASELFSAYSNFRTLARDAAATVAGVGAAKSAVDQIMLDAMASSKQPLVQACMYVQHRGRLAVLKSAVDRVLEGDEPPLIARDFRLGDLIVPPRYRLAMRKLRDHPYAYLYPTFWQVFFWSWGAFIISALQEQEYAALAEQTKIPTDQIENALSAFDILFGENFRVNIFGVFSIIKLVPASIRGLGAFHRLNLYGVDSYDALGLDPIATNVLIDWHNAASALIASA